MLVGEEEHPFRLREGPVENGTGIARGADDAAVPAAEGLQAGGGVDVGDRRHVGCVDDGAEIGPGVFHLLDRGHVGHRAAGGQIGEDNGHASAAAGRHLLGAVGQDVGRLGHEVNAAERDRLAIGTVGGRLRQLVTIPLQVGVGDDAILLVMVAEDHEAGPHLPTHGLDPLREEGVLQAAVGGEWGGKLDGGRRVVHTGKV